MPRSAPKRVQTRALCSDRAGLTLGEGLLQFGALRRDPAYHRRVDNARARGVHSNAAPVIVKRATLVSPTTLPVELETGGAKTWPADQVPETRRTLTRGR
jgi:hypothetical protein